MMNMGFSIITLLLVFVYVPLIGLGIYSMILFIRLGHRGIKALDIYISNNSKNVGGIESTYGEQE